ncbi:MAG: molybdate ABC transporter substrate-binding protein [Myxococcota bacterium]
MTSSTGLVHAGRSRARGGARLPSLAISLGVAFVLVLGFGAATRARAEAASGAPAKAGAPGATAAGQAKPIRVLAAASLTEVVEGLAQDFAGGPVETSFGASSDLARQIRDGAPADVFVSASPDWIAFLREANVLAGEPVLVARNALVCAAPKGSPLAADGKGGARVRDPAALLARLGEGELVAIADAGVPAGDYARRALAKLGLAAGFERRLVGQKDVRAVLHAVEQGEVAAGFVYATDVRVARVDTLFAFDPATHPPIEYHAVVLRGAAQPEVARRFLEHLGSPAARARLSAAGFVLP